MKLLYKIIAFLGLASFFTFPVAAAEVSYTSVLAGTVASIVTVGMPVNEGDVLVTIQSLAGPMAAARANGKGVVKAVYVTPGTAIQQGRVVVMVEEV
ncbi:hypothetical protein [Megasphaera hutchinsoni]|jgi:hypothetical protein|uniref:Lipoyl-binding domain-containing protein n=1 Tax=Megasphaera hutchinsoni TaxID=1588748 RepID=A0A2J8BBM3_9FIRM|nr:hypothetical protein [Megasphaera genomosp. type_2]MUP59205.1 hypothetical protein [Veillonellaceae bacterium M2-4]PNH22184.1 hypothetical protein CAL30_02690 [Megasphaera genomosp. type_2]